MMLVVGHDSILDASDVIGCLFCAYLRVANEMPGHHFCT